MSSGTSLYAVNLEALRAAIGSRDEALRIKVRTAWEPKVPARGLTADAVLLLDGSVVFDGRPFDAESLRSELALPAWNGLFIRLIDQRPRRLVLKGKISLASMQVIFDAMSCGTIVGNERVEDTTADDEFTVEQAIDELISPGSSPTGRTTTRPSTASLWSGSVRSSAITSAPSRVTCC